MTEINWDELESLRQELELPNTDASRQLHTQLKLIGDALDVALSAKDWESIVRLRNIFTFLLATDAITGHPLIQRLENEAISAAEMANRAGDLAHFWGAKGHNLHRLGYHQEAIGAFKKAEGLYNELNEPFSSLENRYMVALCLRALGNQTEAMAVIEGILTELDVQHPWRGNPLQVQAWLLRDEGRLLEAESALREALTYHQKLDNSDIAVASTLAELGEVVGMQRRYEDAEFYFTESLEFIRKHRGHYLRQEARILFKHSDLLIQQKKYTDALSILAEAALYAGGSGRYYDLLWRIELARALIYFRTGRYRNSVAKLRTVLMYRRKLSLSLRLLLLQIVKRTLRRIGLPG